MAVLLLASCHDINTDWRNWLTPAGMNHGWNNLKSWVATQWASFWPAIGGAKSGELSTSLDENIISYAPESQQVATVAPPSTSIAPTIPEEKITILRTNSSEQLPKQELVQEINKFIDRFDKFSHDLSDANRKSISFTELVEKNQQLISNLDEISELNLPKSISNLLTTLNDPELNNDELSRKLASTLAPLQSDLPWNYLKNPQTLRNNALPSHILREFIRFIKHYAENVREPEKEQLKNYARILEAYANHKQPVNLRPHQDLTPDTLLALVRTFKIQQTYNQLYNKRNELRKDIEHFYTDFLRVRPPDLTFLAYFA